MSESVAWLRSTYRIVSVSAGAANMIPVLLVESERLFVMLIAAESKTPEFESVSIKVSVSVSPVRLLVIVMIAVSRTRPFRFSSVSVM